MWPPDEDFAGSDPDDSSEGRRDAEGMEAHADPGPDPGNVPPPAERVWRHPSELQPTAGGPAARPRPAWHTPSRASDLAERHRRRLVLMGAVGTAAVAAAVAAVGLLWESAAGHLQPVTTGAPLLSHVLTTDDVTARGPSVPTAAVPAVRSLVALQVGPPGRATVVCGMAVGAGGLVAAPAAALVRAGGRVKLATATGTAPATEVGIDRASDVALVRVQATLDPAPVSDDGTMAPGHHAMVVSVTTDGAAAPSLDWSMATIASVAVAVPAGTAQDVAGIVADTQSRPGTCGALLLDSSGAVIGLLDTTGSAPGGDVFLPAPLVVGVSDQLALRGTVSHGWLDVSGADAPTASDGGWGGVVVREVEPEGAAAGSLRAGDLILTVSGEPVRSMAELRTRLYVLPPGASVALDVLRGGQRTIVDVELGDSP